MNFRATIVIFGMFLSLFFNIAKGGEGIKTQKEAIKFKVEEVYQGVKISIYEGFRELTIHVFRNSFVYSYILETKNSIMIID